MTYIYDKNISYDIYDKLKIGMNYICIIHKYIFFLVCPMFSLLLLNIDIHISPLGFGSLENPDQYSYLSWFLTYN